VEELTCAFWEMEKNYTRFNTALIADAAKKTFSMTTIGKKLHQLYQR
jgi:hypothetical protein